MLGVSAEPLTEAVDFRFDDCWLREDCYSLGERLDWVIVGGESGPHARPFTLGWGKDLIRQCSAASVPVFMKQVGSKPVNREGEPCTHIKDPKGGDMAEWPSDLRVREFPLERSESQ